MTQHSEQLYLTDGRNGETIQFLARHIYFFQGDKLVVFGADGLVNAALGTGYHPGDDFVVFVDVIETKEVVFLSRFHSRNCLGDFSKINASLGFNRAFEFE